MPLTVPHRLLAGRTAQTGERPRQALDELRQLGPGVPPVPDAATGDQAFLEAQVLERLGRWNPDRWRRQMQPFGIRSVSPRSHEIVLRVPAEFLPDIIRAIMPRWLAEDEASDEQPEISGIPGLRARYEQGQGILGRPGFPGRIAIPATPGLWRKAVRVAAALYGTDGQVRLPWLLTPDDWHPAEVGFTEAWPDAFSPSGSEHRASAFTSRILRRLPGLCPLPRADWHDLWINHWNGTPDIQFEWQNGAAHAAALERLLDPEFGPGAELELLDGQSAQDCYSDMAGRVRARAAGEPGGRVVLRRLLCRDGGAIAGIPDFGGGRRTHRDAVEQAHGYQMHRSRLAPSH
jgi:hypothetical protein